MTAKDIRQKVLDTIDAGHIMPRPRWHFILRNVLVWAIGILCIFIGSVAVSVIIFTLTNGAWNVREALGRGPLAHFLSIFPVIWAMLFCIFIVVAEYAVRATKKGYRYSIAMLSVFIIVGSVVGGTFLHATGISEWTDVVIGKHVPQYETVERRQQRILHNVEQGKLVGVIENVQADKIVLYNGITNQLYEIFLKEQRDIKQPALKVGMRIAILFERDDAGIMYVQQIIPMRALQKHSSSEQRPRLQKEVHQE